jgi:hypothetical protein
MLFLLLVAIPAICLPAEIYPPWRLPPRPVATEQIAQ